MQKLIKAVSSFDYGYLIFVVPIFTFMAFIWSLFISGGVGILFDKPLWSVGTAVFFSIFHLSEFPDMNWLQRFGRAVWLLIMSSGISGIVWMLGTRRPVAAEWWGSVAVVIIIIMVSTGFLLGLIEGIRPNTVHPWIDRVTDWWIKPGV